ncbi:hypothetical protein GCM10020258_21370 [Sphingomonas yabuuchiae]
MLHVDLERVSPLAVPVLVLIGREKVSTGSADDDLLIEAEALAAEAMGSEACGLRLRRFAPKFILSGWLASQPKGSG